MHVVWKAEGKLLELVLCFHCVSSRLKFRLSHLAAGTFTHVAQPAQCLSSVPESWLQSSASCKPAYYHMPAVGRQEDQKFKIILGYIADRKVALAT